MERHLLIGINVYKTAEGRTKGMLLPRLASAAVDECANATTCVVISVSKMKYDCDPLYMASVTVKTLSFLK